MTHIHSQYHSSNTMQLVLECAPLVPRLMMRLHVLAHFPSISLIRELYHKGVVERGIDVSDAKDIFTVPDAGTVGFDGCVFFFTLQTK